MPSATWQNILSQAQLAIQELADTGRTTLTRPELLILVERVEHVRIDEARRTNSLDELPRAIHWDDEDYFDDNDDAEQAPA